MTEEFWFHIEESECKKKLPNLSQGLAGCEENATLKYSDIDKFYDVK